MLYIVFLLTVNVTLHSTVDIINTLTAGSSFGVGQVELLLMWLNVLYRSRTLPSLRGQKELPHAMPMDGLSC